MKSNPYITIFCDGADKNNVRCKREIICGLRPAVTYPSYASIGNNFNDFFVDDTERDQGWTNWHNNDYCPICYQRLQDSRKALTLQPKEKEA